MLTKVLDKKEIRDRNAPRGSYSRSKGGDDNEQREQIKESIKRASIRQKEEEEEREIELSDTNPQNDGDIELKGNKRNDESWKKPARLTINQLSSLYRRLDINGDGEVDLSEFLNVAKKLKMKADPQFLAETFRKVDQRGRGALTLPEFALAYNIVYDHDPEQDMIYKKVPSSVVAIRYGLDKAEKRFIYEVYSGTTTKFQHKTCYFEDGTFAKYHIDRSFRGKPLPSQIVSKNSSSQNELDLSYIVSLIDDDAKWNEMTGSNIMWWVDICTKKIYPSIFIKAFSLPRGLEPMFENEVFDDDRSKRLHVSCKTAEEGDEHGFHHISSLNLFVQTIYLENKPCVNPHPSFLEYLPQFISRPIEYVSDKLAFMYTLDGLRDTELRKSLERSERIAAVRSQYRYRTYCILSPLSP